MRSERNSPTRYIASLDFSFRADSVRTVLQQEGIPFIEEQARDIIVVPVVRNADGSHRYRRGGARVDRSRGRASTSSTR